MSSCRKKFPYIDVMNLQIRMAYNKIKKQFDDDTQEFTNQIISDELRELANKSERTPEEEARFNELNDKTNSEYQEYLIQKGFEEVKDTPDDVITMEEYSDILDVNSGNDVEINGNSVKAADLMEIVFDLFVKE